ncbi:MAG: type II toxin-antitoxin system VapC family toxin [Bryobacteraceae bacterium]|nr:type II toxin-antitoxin system VapC family toxin [Bryobacteraceae bacterium]
MTVVDCSVLADAIRQTKGGGLVAARIFRRGETLCAPHLLDVELVHTLRRWQMQGRMTLDEGIDAIRTLKSLPIRRFSHEFLLDRIWELRHNYTAYDATYISLAEALDATFVTRDAALVVAPQHRARVELI